MIFVTTGKIKKLRFAVLKYTIFIFKTLHSKPPLWRAM